MAKIVLAGPANDPYFPRCELLADQLKSVLPAFEIYKIFIQPNEWDEWLQNTCSKFGWRRARDSKGPIVWRELVSRGGRATLIGDSNDFQEFCRTYYGVKSKLATNYMLRVGAENQSWTNARDAEEKSWTLRQNPVVVTVWNAAADTAQLILSEIAKGGVMPFDDMEFRLAAAPWLSLSQQPPAGDVSESAAAMGNSSMESIAGDAASFIEQIMALEGIQSDLEDMACDNIRRVINCGGNAVTACIGARLIIILIDDSCNIETIEESFKIIGRDVENMLLSAAAQSSGADPNVRVLFVPSHVECMSRTLFKAASSFVAGLISTVVGDDADPLSAADTDLVRHHKFAVNPSKVLCLTTPLENAGKSLVAKQLNVRTPFIHNLLVWTRPPEQTMYPWPFYVDISRAAVGEHQGAIEGPAPFTRNVMDLLAHERKFIAGIHDAVSARYITASGKSLALSAGAIDFIRGWFGGAEKLPNIYLEQNRRNLVFSVGICKFCIPTKEENHEHLAVDQAPVTTQPEPQKPIEPYTVFKSLAIRFSGRDDLDGNGYIIAEDIQPPPEMFVVPQPPKSEEAALEETTALMETLSDGGTLKETIHLVDESQKEDAVFAAAGEEAITAVAQIEGDVGAITESIANADTDIEQQN